MAEAYPLSKRSTFRFWSKVQKGSVNECWPWSAGFFPNGYGAFSARRRTYKAHRIAYTLYNGPIDDGKFVCHRCDNPACCNPNHLWLGSCAENVADRDRKNRQAHGERSPRAKLSAHQIAMIALDTRPQREVAEDYGVCKSTIGNIRRRQSWAHMQIEIDATAINHRNRSEACGGEKNGSAKLTSDQAAEIRNDPRSAHVIAKEYRIGRSTVSNIKSCKSWRSHD